MGKSLVFSRMAVGLTMILAAGAAAAQGSLTPPGPPGPIYKTLDQVEARIPIPSPAFPITQTPPLTISQPGSYYLTSNIVLDLPTTPPQFLGDGIVIDADGVTLDLNGYAIIGPELTGDQISGNGIFINGRVGTTIRNGSILNWGAEGIDASGAAATHLENLVVARNSQNPLTSEPAVDVNNGSIVVNCRVALNGGNGIRARESIVRGCTVQNNDWIGIEVLTGSLVEDCSSRENGSFGISVEELTSGAVVRDNVSSFNGGIGLFVRVNARGNRVEGNTLYANEVSGLRALGEGNLIVRNMARANGDTGVASDEYDIIDSEEAWGGALQADIGSSFNTDRPWINFFTF